MNLGELNLSILEAGAITPVGLGIDALCSKESWVQSSLPKMSRSGETWPVYQVDTSMIEAWQKEPRLRRASPITYYMVEAAHQALANYDGDKKRVGVVTALFTGSIQYSKRFYKDVIEEGQRMASPAIFPETVFNSPTSHLISVLELGGPAYTLVGDESAWTSALVTAATWLKNTSADAVLVIGAEELDPLALEAYGLAGWFDGSDEDALIPAEGAGAVLLSSDKSSKPSIRKVFDGFTYQNKQEAKRAIENCLAHGSDHGGVWRSSCVPWMRTLLQNGSDKKFVDSFLRVGAHAFTASVAWDTIRLCERMEEVDRSVLQLVCGCNHQVSCLKVYP